MRSDYGLYIVAVICFIIAGIFLTGAIPGYTFADSMGMVSIAVFLILGIIFAVAGYATKPKITAAPPVTESMPTMAESSLPPVAPQAEEVMPPEPVAEQPPQEETTTPPEETSMVTEEPAPVPPPEPPLVAVEETAKTEEAKAPEEKPARRRRKRKAE